ncbi:MAG: hypothetical protein ABIK93_03795 [candidate division WOR-3 bacterium]
MIEIKSLGPRFKRLKPTEIEIVEGKFAHTIFQTICQIEPTKTTLTLKLANKVIGTVHAEYEPSKQKTILFDTFVQNDFQRQGLASLMVHLLFREQLLYTPTKNFDIRMVMKATSEKEVIENVGMGLIALKLGFVPAIECSEVFTSKNIYNIEIIPSDGVNPYGYKINLKSSPWTIVLVLLDPLTKKPVPDLTAYEHFIQPNDLVELVQTNQAILGNVDYTLHPNCLDQFVSYIAENQEEVQKFLRKLKR